MSFYKIYQYLSAVALEEWGNAPHHYNYINQLDIRLNPKRTFVKGEMTAVEYYANFDPATGEFDNLIVREDYVYFRENGFVTSRDLTITWFLDDDTASPKTKIRTKHYGTGEAITEGKRRRKTLVDILSSNVVGLISTTEGTTIEEASDTGQAFLDGLATEITAFERSGSSVLAEAVVADTSSTWLENAMPSDETVSIRDFIVSEVTL